MRMFTPWFPESSPIRFDQDFFTWDTSSLENWKLGRKNSAYRRHWIPQPMRIVSPLSWREKSLMGVFFLLFFRSKKNPQLFLERKVKICLGRVIQFFLGHARNWSCDIRSIESPRKKTAPNGTNRQTSGHSNPIQ